MRLSRFARQKDWKHIRTTIPIESTFATVRHRTTKTKGCLSRQTALAPLGSMLRMHLPGNA